MMFISVPFDNTKAMWALLKNEVLMFIGSDRPVRAIVHAIVNVPVAIAFTPVFVALDVAIYQKGE